jgi:uncharacterized protein YdeI (YjbR/CyaY-like superfamily)
VDELPILDVATAKQWGSWLKKNHAQPNGVRLRFLKKAHAAADSLNYKTALDEALCWGWIDGQVQRSDERSYLQRFTPRRAKSSWSKINCGHIERLTREGRMQKPGIAAVEAAKSDGRWDRAYASPSRVTMPPDFEKRLKANAKAKKFFATLSSANRYAIFYRLENAKKQVTRERWLERILGMLERGEAFH